MTTAEPDALAVPPAAGTAPLAPPAAPAWRTALLPLAYAASLMAVLFPLSHLWPDLGAPAAQAPGGRAATAALLAEQVSRKLSQGADCVRSRWQSQLPASVDTCLVGGWGLTQVFVLPAPGSSAQPRAVAADREQVLGRSVEEVRQRALTPGQVTYLPSPRSGGDVSPGVDQVLAVSGAQGTDLLLLRHRSSSLQLSGATGAPLAASDLEFRDVRDLEGDAAAGARAVPVPQAGSLNLVLREPMPDKPPSADGGRWWLDASGWLSVVALSLLALAGLALRLDLKWRAKERRYVADLNEKVRENELLNARQQALNERLQERLLQNQLLNDQLIKLDRELIEVVYASEQIHTWKNLIGPVVNSMGRCRKWLQAQPDVAASAEAQRQIAWLDNGLKMAYQLAHGLEAFSLRPDAAEPVQVHALVAESFALSKVKAGEAGVDLVSTVSPHLPPVLIEPGLIKMALSGLIDNAVRAMSGVPRGNAVLQVSARQLDDGRRVRLTLRDNGVGMSEAQRLAMQQGLYGNAGALDGHGTGVARCRVILQRSRGELGAITSSAEGSAIDVILPVALMPEEQPAAADEPELT